ncbi:alpha/beta hydrolase [Histidinibacterium lentulum]|uniref:Alpha/beta hydrolase n=1 Tax=Histidinibacterium lentulum TaxID=2480588 RepID=A0A3N2RAG0_9RHOB|nr:alpha/beta hydrolase [Histidinibacterium lentulum]
MRATLLGLAAVIALGTVATGLRLSARVKAGEAAYPPEGRFVTVEGRRIHAVVSGEGPDVVLIHGSSGNTRDMTFRLAPILARTYRVIAFDRPGLGYSDRLQGKEGIEAQARVLQAAAAQLGAEKPIVLGQSYGGAVALAWAARHPASLSALVAVSSPSQRWEGDLPALYRLTSHPLGSALAVPLISAWVPPDYVAQQIRGVFGPQEMPPGYAEAIGAPLITRPESLRANAAQRATLKQEITALQPHYATITVPLEIVHGTADTTVPFEIHAEPLARQAPTAHLMALPGIGHIPQNVAPEAVAEAVDRAARRAGLN